MKAWYIILAFLSIFGLAIGLPDCQPEWFKCDNGYDIPTFFVCDGNNQCGDWSDEPDDCPPCPCKQWQCATGECISNSSRCDGFNNCGDWSDETYDACPCRHDEIRCPDQPGESGHATPGKCILAEYTCDPDGIWDCADGWDEANCTFSVDLKTITKLV